MKILVFFALLVACLKAKKFLLLTNQMPSHTMMVWSIGSELAEEGHDVVAITKKDFEANKLKHFEKNIKTWQFEPIKGPFANEREAEKKFFDFLFQEVLAGKRPPINPNIVQGLYNETIAIVENKELMNKIRDYKFDGAILDGFVLARFFAVIPYHFGIPIFTVTDMLMDPAIQIASLPSHIPHLLTPFTERMSFTERLLNFVSVSVICNPTTRKMVIPQMPTDYLFKKFVRDDKIKHWDDLIAKSELFIITRNHMLEYPAPTWPNTITTHSLTVRPFKPLTEKFEKMVLKHPDKKLVFVSFGSHGDLIPSSFSMKLLEAFGSFNDVHFIWSYRLLESDAEKVPSNVDIVPWAPQNDLLGHDRVSAFITHGGQNGQSESVYHGKPMLCIPLFAEQPHNAVRIAYRKYGKYLFPHELTTEKLQLLLREVLNNDVYAKNVRRASEIIKSQLVPDIKRVTHEILTITEHAKRFLLLTNQMPSHAMMVWSIGSVLGVEGHDVVAITKTNFERNKLKHFEKNIKVWEYEPIESYFDKTGGMKELVIKEALERTIAGKQPKLRPDMLEYIYNETVAMVDNIELMNKIRDYKFDGAILDGFFIARFFAIIPHHFRIPIFTVTDSLTDPVIQPVSLPSYTPSLFLPCSEQMSFTERLLNFALTVLLRTQIMRNMMFPQIPTDNLFKKYVADDKIKHWDDLVKESELFIVSRNHMLEYPAPIWPNTLLAHSLTVRSPKPLTEKFEKMVLKHPDKKLVFVSFGSHGDLIPSSFSMKLLEVFGSFNDVHFIWSYRLLESDAEKVPSNVDIVPWAPQNDLLGHDRVSAFITHGGQNGQSESVYHGKPMLCIPLFAEQPHNAVRIAYRKYGKYLFPHELTTEKLQLLLREVLNNDVYAKNVRRASEIIKSQLVPDIKRVTHEILTITEHGHMGET
ncbi:DgyrCDS3139 [Dimorphilus gyrociliatus]|uniref:DgyrCDS3139 n=1 Tax=Dimorphilus gyrociliatus TaxID=2664684 RepID=A0A7I8VF18_9ANNE|nr:DgyrCDS3139 [Dimorphilus gyrociliatus]